MASVTADLVLFAMAVAKSTLVFCGRLGVGGGPGLPASLWAGTRLIDRHVLSANCSKLDLDRRFDNDGMLSVGPLYVPLLTVGSGSSCEGWRGNVQSETSCRQFGCATRSTRARAGSSRERESHREYRAPSFRLGLAGCTQSRD